MATAGRPSSYTPEKAEEILNRIAAGESMRSVCRDDDMPALSTLRRWEEDVPEFARKCARAREYQGDSYADKLDDIYDLVMSGQLDPKVAAEARGNLQWKAERLSRRRYGNGKLDGDGSAPTTVNVNVTTTDPVEAGKAYQKMISRD